MSNLAQQIREDARRRELRRRAAAMTGHGTPLDIDRGSSFPLAMPDRGAGDDRPWAMSADPCSRCATRGTLGCSHQKPFDPTRSHFHA